MSLKTSPIDSVIKYEKYFSRNKYNGYGRDEFKIKEGNIPVMISAPHSINQFREGQLKYADMYTGGIALLLHELTGCHVIFSSKYKGKDPNYDPNPNGENLYQTTFKYYVDNDNIFVVFDFFFGCC